MFRALRHRDFRYLQGGQFATHMGQWIQQLGKGWLVYQITESPMQLALVAFFQGMAMLFSSPIGGLLADRFDRRRVLYGSQGTLMVVALIVALLVITDVVQVWHVYLAALVSGAGFALNSPSRQSLVYDLVGKEDLPNAIALNSVSMNTTRVLGPTLGGVLLAVFGVEGTFLAQAGGYAVALLALVMMRGGSGTAHVTERVPMKESLVSGFRYVRRNRTIAVVLVGGFIGVILGWPYVYLLPALATETLGAGEKGLGIMMGAVGIGAIVGALYIAGSDGGHRGRQMLGAFLATGAGLVLLGIASGLPVALVILACIGLCNAISMASSQMLVQLNVEDQYRGRVISIYFLGFGLQPLGVLPAGAISEAFGVQVGLLVMGITMIVVMTGIILLMPRLRSL